jgi:hypothetical protein
MGLERCNHLCPVCDFFDEEPHHEVPPEPSTRDAASEDRLPPWHAELEGIRKRDATTGPEVLQLPTSVFADRRALLRIYDELSAHFDDIAEEFKREWNSNIELRPKLTTAEQNAATWESSSHGYSARCEALRDTVEDLRGKLATVSLEYGDVAHAVGIAYEADGHPIAPGPVERIIEAVRDDQAKARMADELEAKLAATAATAEILQSPHFHRLERAREPEGHLYGGGQNRWRIDLIVPDESYSMAIPAYGATPEEAAVQALAHLGEWARSR